jgi:ADP-ribose diphosphatase
VLPDGRVLLIRQYRMAAGRQLWELPAGTRDRGETPSQTARRELGEETGYRSTRWTKLLSFYPSPGIISERMHLFLAQDVRAGAAHPESDEHIAVRPFSPAQLNTLITRGRIVDGKTLVGLLYWLRRKRA